MNKLWRGLTLILLAGGICISPGCKKEADTESPAQPEPEVQQVQKEETPEVDWSELKLGEQVSFEMTYRGCSGSKDDISPSSGWYGFGTSENSDSPFFKAVKEQTENKLIASNSSYFPGGSPGVFEQEGDDVIALYFDLDGDGKLAENEKIGPTEGANNPFGSGNCFVTPDFQHKTRTNKEIPFRIMACVNMYGGGNLDAIWRPMGMFEGKAAVDGVEYNVYLFAPFHGDSYTKFGSSSIGIAKADDSNRNIMSNSLSSINYFNNKFYRIKFEDTDSKDKTLTAIIAEDKGERGKVAIELKGKEELKANLTYAIIYGADDRSINFRFSDGVKELPVGNYTFTYGRMDFGKDSTEEYRTTFENVEKFSIKAGETTKVELGNIKTEITAIENNNRYNADKKFKTEFPEDTNIYVDVDFTGTAKESYRDFYKLVKENNHTSQQVMPIHMTITDSDNNEIMSQDLEYG